MWVGREFPNAAFAMNLLWQTTLRNTNALSPLVDVHPVGQRILRFFCYEEFSFIQG
jgi:hypothetical protein